MDGTAKLSDLDTNLDAYNVSGFFLELPRIRNAERTTRAHRKMNATLRHRDEAEETLDVSASSVSHSSTAVGCGCSSRSLYFSKGSSPDSLYERSSLTRCRTLMVV